MRIRLFLGADLDNNKIPERTLQLLRSELEKDKSIVLTDQNPDVIHFIGAWNSASQGIAKDAHTKYIATIHTPLASLSPWQKPSSTHVKLTSKCTFIIASGLMEKELLDEGSRTNLQLIPNAITTKTTSKETMVDEYKKVYSDAITTTDSTLWTDIEHQVSMIRESDEAILNICKNLLYAQCMYIRKNIPQSFLNKMSECLYKSDYDEDRLGEVLKLIKLYVFTQRLEYLMQETAGLTEGFMPLPMKEDKAAKAMQEFITNY